MSGRDEYFESKGRKKHRRVYKKRLRGFSVENTK